MKTDIVTSVAKCLGALA